MDEKIWLKKTIQLILAQDKSDIEKTTEIMKMVEAYESMKKITPLPKERGREVMPATSGTPLSPNEWFDHK